MQSEDPEEILNFWFGSPSSSDYGQERPFWFASTPQWDSEIRKRFLVQYENASAGMYSDWTLQPRPSLALTLLLDQVPRNIFRGTAKQYATDTMSLEVAKNAISQGFFDQLHSSEQKFCIMPFSHSEIPEDQDTAVKLFKKIGNKGWYDYAKWYHSLISRFGRFPHRNKTLGRVNTAEENLYLSGRG